MSGDNLYPTIDSMIIEDIIKYLREKRNIIITCDICSCNSPIKMSESGENINKCMKCGKSFDYVKMSQKESLTFQEGLSLFGETS